ncbi:MAG: PAS domain S-box protein [Pseudomonadota bacterium]
MAGTSTIATPAAEDQLSALLDAAVDAMVLIDERGIVTRFNRAAERVFGYAASEVVGRNVSMLMPQPYRREHDGYLERYQRTGEARIIGIGREVVAQRKDGSTFPIDLAVGEFITAAGRGYVGILRDIYERKRQEEQLRQNGEELRLIFEYAPTAILITDLHGQILNANRACCELFGYSAEQLSGIRHSDLLRPDDRPAALAGFERLRRSGGSEQRELRYLKADGSMFYALHYAATATAAGGRPLMLIVEIVDRSALYEATREAEELRTRLAHVSRIGTLGEMVSGIAHEVNQPLTAIANYASACRRMMLAGQTSPGEMLSILEKIAAQAERAGEVIRGLRALAKRGDSRRQPLDCNQLVREVLRIVEFELRGAEVALDLRLASRLTPVLADGVQIQQVVLNLIRNAMEAMGEAGSGKIVVVETEQTEPEWVTIRVSDRGPGLSAEVARRLFEPFFTTKKHGMGLGLSICQSIATAHGGELSYRRNEWRGATFALRLPAIAGEGEA